MYVDKHIPKINVVSSTNLKSPLHGLMLKFAIVLGLKSVYINNTMKLRTLPWSQVDLVVIQGPCFSNDNFEDGEEPEHVSKKF